MRYLKYLALLGFLMLLIPSHSQAQVSFGIGIGTGYGYVGAAPVCTYGYYDYYPYDCAPYGYYGPDWFTGGVFIGAGPWFGFRDRDRFFGRGFRGRDGFDRGFHGGFHGGGF